MHRRLSNIVSSSSKSLSPSDDDSVTTAVPEEPLAPLNLKVKRVDHYFSKWSNSWKYKNTTSKVFLDNLPFVKSAQDAQDTWKDFSFVIVRELSQNPVKEPEMKIAIKSPYLLRACQDVVQYWPGISWLERNLTLDPHILLAWLPGFNTYKAELETKKQKTQAEINIISSVDLLVSTLRKDYATTLGTIQRLTSHGEITHDLLWAILVPRSYVVSLCAVTGLPRVFKLVHAIRTTVGGKIIYSLGLEFVDLVDDGVSPNKLDIGRVQTNILIPFFKGTAKITNLAAYPLEFAANEQAIRDAVTQRGKTWTNLVKGMPHHRQYHGVAAYKKSATSRVTQGTVNGRIMIDRVMFKRYNPDYPFQPLKDRLPVSSPEEADPTYSPPHSMKNSRNGCYSISSPPPPLLSVACTNDVMVDTDRHDPLSDDLELSEEELLLSPTTVYGYSLSDKKWFEFGVETIREVEWNQQAFENLVLPEGRKELLKCLVEFHNTETSFDDFVKGKGKGLVVNLFGPPGVGKTFSAEATSEHVKKPLYIVGAGDLGSTASEMETRLEKIFSLATAWNAIVLIDEADVFMEQRSLTDLERNAMVATFLRHIEYYQGQLFLTTNRIQAFDDAFLSRIHVALHFTELSDESRTQIWSAFLKSLDCTISKDELEKLAKYNVNGRQIKNAVRTAHSLSIGKGETLGIKHLTSTIEMMEEFSEEFARIRA